MNKFCECMANLPALKWWGCLWLSLSSLGRCETFLPSRRCYLREVLIGRMCFLLAPIWHSWTDLSGS